MRIEKFPHSSNCWAKTFNLKAFRPFLNCFKIFKAA